MKLLSSPEDCRKVNLVLVSVPSGIGSLRDHAVFGLFVLLFSGAFFTFVVSQSPISPGGFEEELCVGEGRVGSLI